MTLNALWFASGGFSLILLACINYLVVTSTPRGSFFALGYISNVLGALLLALVLYFLRAPHVAVILLLIITEAILLIRLHTITARATPNTLTASNPVQ
ncbi:hypothetical protein [Dictyobacter aurantiacus]|uniref:Uncharacterized protein n=1 Tax=Dictyobacter aurantiacus TaxID=1936993 RepID=A0A401ZKV7_9CHLR|nr:hypothetical protein [Dictyobacter aurantiacus]GCE07458.1 hypothetical protein KDAU_47870 [Dictyobacter aurantiacus]